MRVMMTADAVGGVWTYALDLVRALPDVEFTVATMGRRPSPDQITNLPANLTLHIGDYRLEWEENPWDDVWTAGDWLLALEDDVRPDVVHLNGFVHAALPFRAPVLSVFHSDVLSWWQAVKGVAAPAEWDRYRDEVRRGLQAAGLVAAPTRAMIDEAERLYGPFQRTATLPNGRDGIVPGSKEPFVFAAGRMWDEAKNVAALDSLQVAWPVRIAGEGSPLGRLPSAEVQDLMVRASIYALPARYEPFGLSVLEAALAGCALVLGDIPTLRENWDDRALFVEPDDHEGLQMAVTSLIEDPNLRTSLGARARTRGLEFSLERFGQGYREIYGRLGRDGESAQRERRFAEGRTTSPPPQRASSGLHRLSVSLPGERR